MAVGEPATAVLVAVDVAMTGGVVGITGATVFVGCCVFVGVCWVMVDEGVVASAEGVILDGVNGLGVWKAANGV